MAVSVLSATVTNFKLFFNRLHPVARTKFMGHRDMSITQFAVADDDNVSQPATKGGGGGLTLASQWKSQFDDSEETDNELKADNLQSPEHKKKIAVGTHLGILLLLVVCSAAVKTLFSPQFACQLCYSCL